MEEGRVMTACLYRYKDMLFAYYESIGEELAPQQVYGPMGELLELWPGEDGSRDWVYMYHVYYHGHTGMCKGLEEKGRARHEERKNRVSEAR